MSSTQKKQMELQLLNQKWASAAPGVPLQTTPVRNQSQNEIENDLLGHLQYHILSNYVTDFEKANNVWTNFSQIYTYDTPFDEEAFMDETTGEPLDRKDVKYQNILEYWTNFIEQRRSELEKPPRSGGKKASKKKPKKANKKKTKKARKSSRNTMVRKKSRRH